LSRACLPLTCMILHLSPICLPCVLHVHCSHGICLACSKLSKKNTFHQNLQQLFLELQIIKHIQKW
jgi:hypothetical protein